MNNWKKKKADDNEEATRIIKQCKDVCYQSWTIAHPSHQKKPRVNYPNNPKSILAQHIRVSKFWKHHWNLVVPTTHTHRRHRKYIIGSFGRIDNRFKELKKK